MYPPGRGGKQAHGRVLWLSSSWQAYKLLLWVRQALYLEEPLFL
jgi:hypothetical protein